ncbi:tyrosine-type recombinase/integrase [Melghirimyces algeriensis]|uniref:Site-specific recombinase XerD n=1 Tax=Melghirimyces algeriensis TaxID=910412 RepID=A0A521BCX8_9BACL|nr:tyrosine-type recombinase/integrase [Melghirimyces algeriensis]SMO44909.1 Site-specific recombinase XerD [Melghirimyces algeriensis]
MKGHVRKRGKKWCFVLDIGKDPSTGKRKQKWFSGFPTKKEAQRALAEKMAEINRGDYVEPSKMNVGDFLDEWLVSEVKMSRSAHTFDMYQNLVKNHLKPGLGSASLDKLTPLHIQQFMGKISEKDLSISTINYILRVLKTALSWAVTMEMIPKNPASNISPKSGHRTTMKTWTAEQVNRFLQTAKGNRYYLAFYLALTTGMRQGEILGLEWSDIDFESGFIRIQRMLEESSQGSRIVERTKSDAGRRSIALSESALEVVKQHQKEQKQEMLKRGYRSDQLFVTLQGKPLSSRSLRYHFRSCIQKADVPHIRFHDLRHTHASLLLQQGVHPKVVQERLGHSSISMTLDTYSHVIPSMQKEAAQTLDEIIGK